MGINTSTCFFTDDSKQLKGDIFENPAEQSSSVKSLPSYNENHSKGEAKSVSKILNQELSDIHVSQDSFRTETTTSILTSASVTVCHDTFEKQQSDIEFQTCSNNNSKYVDNEEDQINQLLFISVNDVMSLENKFCNTSETNSEHFENEQGKCETSSLAQDLIEAENIEISPNFISLELMAPEAASEICSNEDIKALDNLNVMLHDSESNGLSCYANHSNLEAEVITQITDETNIDIESECGFEKMSRDDIPILKSLSVNDFSLEIFTKNNAEDDITSRWTGEPDSPIAASSLADSVSTLSISLQGRERAISSLTEDQDSKDDGDNLEVNFEEPSFIFDRLYLPTIQETSASDSFERKHSFSSAESSILSEARKKKKIIPRSLRKVASRAIRFVVPRPQQQLLKETGSVGVAAEGK